MGEKIKFNPLSGQFDLVKDLTTIDTTSLEVGVKPNYLSIDTDGNLTLYGAATQFRDELNDLIKQSTNNPSSHLVQDFAEGTLDFKNNCDLNDYAVMNIQINHDYKLGTTVHPHIHWFQKENKTPNWLVQYRWQYNGASKTTSWTNLPLTSNAFTYTSGDFVQITGGNEITPATSIDVSSILQIRIIRDVANASGLFAGTDTYTGDAEALNFDIHIEIDSFGSNLEYSKELVFLVDQLGNLIVDESGNLIYASRT